LRQFASPVSPASRPRRRRLGRTSNQPLTISGPVLAKAEGRDREHCAISKSNGITVIRSESLRLEDDEAGDPISWRLTQAARHPSSNQGQSLAASLIVRRRGIPAVPPSWILWSVVLPRGADCSACATKQLVCARGLSFAGARPALDDQSSRNFHGPLRELNQRDIVPCRAVSRDQALAQGNLACPLDRARLPGLASTSRPGPLPLVCKFATGGLAKLHRRRLRRSVRIVIDPLADSSRVVARDARLRSQRCPVNILGGNCHQRCRRQLSQAKGPMRHKRLHCDFPSPESACIAPFCGLFQAPRRLISGQSFAPPSEPRDWLCDWPKGEVGPPVYSVRRQGASTLSEGVVASGLTLTSLSILD